LKNFQNNGSVLFDAVDGQTAVSRYSTSSLAIDISGDACLPISLDDSSALPSKRTETRRERSAGIGRIPDDGKAPLFSAGIDDSRDAKQFDNYRSDEEGKVPRRLWRIRIAARRRLVSRMQITGIIHILP